MLTCRKHILFLLVFLCLTVVGADSPKDKIYLFTEGRVIILTPITVQGERYILLDDVAPLIKIKVEYKDKGILIKGKNGEIAISEDLSMAIVGSYLHSISPPALKLNERIWIPKKFVATHFANISEEQFSFSETAPVAEPKKATCSIQVKDKQHIIFVFSEDVVLTAKNIAGGISIFAEDARLKFTGDSLPSNIRISQDRLPLGDAVKLAWEGEGAPIFDFLQTGKREGILKISFGEDRAKKRSPARTVVIDPGHGGEASGAKGKNGLLEKDVVLKIALKLKNVLVGAGFEVFLTREVDANVPLKERAEFANARRADVFVSIHANASRRLSARGAETYFLSYQALDDEARQIALIENQGETAVGAGPQTVDLILWHMAQAQYLGESAQLAEEIQKQFNKLLATPDRGVKQAPFAVLMGAAMPAVLVEVGFISNEEEEQKLASDEYCESIARAIAESVANFKILRDGRLGIGSREAQTTAK